MLIGNREGNAEGGRWKLTMGDSIGDNFDSEALNVADRFVAALAVTHNAWKLENFRDPAAVLFAIQIDRQIHLLIILLARAISLSRTG